MKQRKNVLLITYYWPPSGGAGVQRWLKFTKYFQEFDVNCTVITVDPEKATYPVKDNSLLEDVSGHLKIYKTNTSEPYKYYKAFTSEKSVPHAGFSNESNPSLFKKFTRFIRGNFFIPDARKGWNKYAFKKACELIEQDDFDAIITTSPPHSTQLVGLQLKKKYGLEWIADFRDPWTDIYYYDKMLHTKRSKEKDALLERTVLNNADKVIVVSDAIKRLLQNKTPGKYHYHVIPNGYDEADFNDTEVSEKIKSKQFCITYTGTISDDYPLDSFLESIKQCNSDILLRFVGIVSPDNKTKLEGYNVEYTGYVDHSESVNYLKAANALLLIIPEIENNAGILTGKLFEYIGSGKPIIMFGPVEGDAAAIIKETGSGKCFAYDDVQGASEYIKNLNSKEAAVIPDIEKSQLYSRRSLTGKVVELL